MRVNDVRWDVPVSPRVSVSWNARPVVPDGVGTLHLRAALGEVANVPQTTRLVFPVLFRRARATEGRGHARARAGVRRRHFPGPSRASLTWYNKRTSNVGNVLHGGGPNPNFLRFEVLNRGIEASLHARIVQTSRLTWDARAWYAYNHNEVTGGAASAGLPTSTNQCLATLVGCTSARSGSSRVSLWARTFATYRFRS